MNSTNNKPGRFRWVIASLIFCVYTVAAADRANIGVVLPFIRSDFHMSNTEAGALASLFLLAYAIAQIPSGFLYAKFGVRKIFSISMILTSLATCFVGFSTSILGLKVSRFILGLAEGPLPIGITSTINRWFPASEKGLVTAIFYQRRNLARSLFLRYVPSLSITTVGITFSISLPFRACFFPSSGI